MRGYWLTTSGRAKLTQVVYRSAGPHEVRVWRITLRVRADGTSSPAAARDSAVATANAMNGVTEVLPGKLTWWWSYACFWRWYRVYEMQVRITGTRATVLAALNSAWHAWENPPVARARSEKPAVIY